MKTNWNLNERSVIPTGTSAFHRHLNILEWAQMIDSAYWINNPIMIRTFVSVLNSTSLNNIGDN